MRQQDPAIVEVQNTSSGKIISLRESDGTVRRIEIGSDGRISSADAGSPGGAISVAPAPSRNESRNKAFPDGLVDMMGIIFGAVTVMSLGMPIVKAWARRFERRTDLAQQAVVEQRLAGIERAIESVAVEVERISEGQRFTTKLLAERAPVEMEQIR